MKTKIVSQEIEKKLRGRLADARKDLDKFGPIYNDYYDLSYPAKLRVSDESDEIRNPDNQDDIFDPTLQQVTEDFVADMADEFTPSYRPWTRHEATEIVDPRMAPRVDQYIKLRMDTLYDNIRRSSFEEASQECYHDMGIGPFAMCIRYAQAGPVDCEYVPLAQLRILPGPRGGVGFRAWERTVQERHLTALWPDLDWAKILEKPLDQINDSNARIPVAEIWERDFTKGVETWCYYAMVKNHVVFKRETEGRGSCSLIVGRTRVSAPSAYGLGPAAKGIPPARTLNRLAYLELKRLAKIVDPPGVFSDPEGVFNPEQGFEAGYWYEIGDGYKVQEIAPQTDMREAFFQKDKLEMAVKAAMFQDKPYQKGLTPPSASQWLGEEAQQEKRKTLPRARVHTEWVMEIIHRFEWILEKRGELKPLEIDKRVIRIAPKSPLSRAADIQEAQVADQLLTMFYAKFPEQASQGIDLQETMRKLKAKLGDDIVKIFSEEEMMERAMQMMQAQAQAQAQGGAPQQGAAA